VNDVANIILGTALNLKQIGSERIVKIDLLHGTETGITKFLVILRLDDVLLR
jgi:hypothetical protein